MNKKLFIVGGGFMGSGIAQTAICSGLDVMLNDINMDILDRARKNIEHNLKRRFEKGKLTETAMNESLNRLTLTMQIADAADADLVIEAAAENVEVKKSIFSALSETVSSTAILATNTSSIPITELAAVVKYPERFVGMHFFSPVPAMKLLELVKGLSTSEQTIAAAKEYGAAMGKVCIVSKDAPAFIVNRLLDPMLNEAVMLLDMGTGSVEDIDAGVKNGLNHPMGPFELMDMVGIDITLAVMEVLYRETADSKYRPAMLMKNMVRANWLGKKSGIGFYVYKEDGSRVVNPNL